jgi:predicted 3-demethylubiquinone-9 3-methyltransferase (glyoxalase superfamily)
MQKARVHLWFDDQALEAMKFYADVIPDSRVDDVLIAPEGIPGARPGEPFSVEGVVGGVEVIFLNAGPIFKLNEAFSFVIEPETQAEIDHYWDVLIADGGEPSQCGWLKDKFGVSWQVIPPQLKELSGDYTTDANKRVVSAMFKMTKIDIAALEAAYNDPSADMTMPTIPGA